MSERDLSSAVEVPKGNVVFARTGCRILPLLALLGSLLATAALPNSVAAQDAWKSPEWLMDSAQAKQFYRVDYFKNKAEFRAAAPGNAGIAKMKKVVHYYLSQLTHEDNTDLPKTVDRLLNEMAPTLTTPAVRQILMDEILARAPEILTHPKDIVRFNMLSAVVQLNLKPAQYQGSTEIPAVPYNPAHKLLIQVLIDPKQSLDCRILAAKGLARICRDGDGAPSSNEKSDIAQALVDTLAATPPSSEDGIWWFRNKMIEALGFVDRIDNSATQPIVVEALLDIIVNRKELFLNRTLAAQGISQLPLSSSTNLPLITVEICKLLGEMCASYAKAPTSVGWQEPFVRIYLSFKPATVHQAKVRKWGLLFQLERTGLATHAAVVKGAFDVVFPICKPFLEKLPQAPLPPPPSASLVKALNEWVQKNEPTNRSVVPNGKLYPAKPSQVVGAN
ncbi:hypothetical protein [Planctomicrobium piriforme]|uniref:HEAT repeat-containing protein n=1 Tax=Planctomicrobium piriforme TaxID=1576369 RepID=A0A1I3Q8C2_9PLAN|nr:hypothetical protein [Planctomicrobium piriforme]SFJ30494.1 hypothetical protein SAMN05421753_11813 [Planctomicrobium piriforme]